MLGGLEVGDKTAWTQGKMSTMLPTDLSASRHVTVKSAPGSHQLCSTRHPCTLSSSSSWDEQHKHTSAETIERCVCAKMATPGGVLLFLLLLITAAKISAYQSKCGGIVCPPGMDCIERGGKTRCADPCEIYTPLDDHWRDTQFASDRKSLKCDRDVEWKGWYRLLLGGKSARIPERCIEEYRCGGDTAIWMKDPHPTQWNEIVARTVYGSWWGNCSRYTTNIHVKKCSHYYVYKLVKPGLCYQAYCAELAPPFLSHITCGSDKILVGVNSTDISVAVYNPYHGHLEDSKCLQTKDENGTVLYETDAQTGTCGNKVQTNSTHVIYSNTLYIYLSKDVSHPMKLPFSCVYPLATHTRLNSPIRTILPGSGKVNQHQDDPSLQSGAPEVPPPYWKDVVFVGSGPKLGASMVLFKESDYKKPYPAGVVVLPVGSPLYVEVSMRDPSLVVVLEECFVARSPDRGKLDRYSIISNKCPTDRQQVFEFKSGSSHQARFSTLPFAFQGEYQDVYLHCSFILCDRKSSSCIPDCEELDPPFLSDIICDSDEIGVGVDSVSTRRAGYNPLRGRLADPKCFQAIEQSSVVWYKVDTEEGTCGNKMKTNGTHVIYSNTLFIDPAKNSPYSLPMGFPFSCVYPLDTHTRLNSPFRTILTPDEEDGQHQVPDGPSHQDKAQGVLPYWKDGVFVGSGPKLGASMVLFKESDYKKPYPAGVVVLPVGSPLYVEVSMRDPSLVFVLEECFASHSLDRDSLDRYSIISNKCPTDRQQVFEFKSGSSHQARFSTLPFAFQGEYQDVYLHCSFILCDHKSSSCIPDCEELDPPFLSDIICDSDEIGVGVDSVSTRRAGYNPLRGRLADPKCFQAIEQSSVVWYKVDTEEGTCGNKMKTNSTHVIYSNTLFINPAKNSPYSLPMGFPFSCVYPLDTHTRLNSPFRTILTPDEEDGQHQVPDGPSHQDKAQGVLPYWKDGVFVGSGPKLGASMVLFKESDYKKPYPAGVVVLPVGSPLYVEVSMRDPSLVVVLEECFASHSLDRDSLDRYSIISNKCPTDRQQVFEFKSGSSHQARFSTLPFAFQGEYQDVYLNCSFILCDRKSSSCIPDCEELDPPFLSDIICDSDEIGVGVDSVSTRRAGYNPLRGRLADPKCFQAIEQSSVVWYKVDTEEGTCGNKMKTNGTHVIYSNTLFIDPAKNSPYSLPMGFPFSCVYPLDTHTRLNSPFRTILTPDEEDGQHQVPDGPSHQDKAQGVLPHWKDGVFVGSGPKLGASMVLFKESDYKKPYPAGVVVLPVGSPLYVEVSMRDPSLVVVLEECFVSRSPDRGKLDRYSIISNKCPTDRQQVFEFKSGSSHQARFSTLPFAFQGEYQDVYLNCSFILCDRKSSSCIPDCEELDPPFLSDIICDSDEIGVGVDSVSTRRAGYNPLRGRLADPKCFQAIKQSSVVWYKADTEEGTCGNKMKTNGTHVIYSNTLFIDPAKNSPYSLPMGFPFSCVYPLDTHTRLNSPIRTFMKAMGRFGQHQVPDGPSHQDKAQGVLPYWKDGVFVGSGPKLGASMVLFKESDYKKPYPAGVVVLPVGSPLYVEVSMREPSLVVVLEECFVARSPDRGKLDRYSIISNKCPTDRQQVFEFKSGSSHQARFSTLPFAFHRELQDVYLHCSFILCDRKSSSCIPDCEELDPPFLSDIICDSDEIGVGVDSVSTRRAGFNPLLGHLAQAMCFWNIEQYSVVWYKVDTEEGTCGNKMKTNGTHVIYSNTLYIYPVFKSPVSLFMGFPFSCVYPLDTHTRLSSPIRAILTPDEEDGQHQVPDGPSHQDKAQGVLPHWKDGVFVGSGPKLGASMVLFKESDYKKPYPAGVVVLPVGSPLYVEVSMRDPSLVVVLEECFASHSLDRDSLDRYSIISNKCPFESSSSLQARFSTLFFRFWPQYRDVYLHCSLSLCDRRSSSCTPYCEELDRSLTHLNCGSDKIQVGVDSAGLRSTGHNPLSGHLEALKCSQATKQDGVVWYKVDAQEGACGNTMKTNGTHVIYSNTLFIDPANNSPSSLPMTFPFSCVYPLDTHSRLKVPINATLTPSQHQVNDDPSRQPGALEVPPYWMEGVLVGSGPKLGASMVLFKESDYKEPYAAGVVVLPAASPLYVEVSMDKKDPSLVVVLEECSTSHSPDRDSLDRYSLISNKCLTDRQHMSVFESGSSLQARFSTPFFLLQGRGQDVYLHCSLSLCDRRSSSCIPVCEEFGSPFLSHLNCGSDKIQMGVDSAKIKSAGYDPFYGNLKLSKCSLATEKDGVTWYQADTKTATCGNVMKTNGTHVIFSNTLFIYPANKASFVSLKFPFSCVYPLKTDTRLKAPVRPILPSFVHGAEVGQHRDLGDPSQQVGPPEVPPRWMEGVFVGSGPKLGASMFLFTESDYKEPYPAGVVVLPVGSPLYVEVSVRDPSLVVVLEDCFASSDPDSLEQEALIHNKCPADRHKVSVVPRGPSLQARFSTLFFPLQGKYQDVYLHCSLNLCDRRSSSCIPVCEELDASLRHLICDSDKIRVGMDSARIRRTGYNPLSGKLADRKCSQKTEQDGVVWYEVDAQEGACGNTMKIKSTHVIYSNTLFIYPASRPSFLPLTLNFSCVYPLDTHTRLNTAIKPSQQSNGTVGQHEVLYDPSQQYGAVKVASPYWKESGFVVSGPKLGASMFLFKESDYKEPYPAGVVVLPVGSPLYVEVSVDKKDPSLVVVLEDCFASHSSDPDSLDRYSLISNKCPTDHQRISELKSGSSHQARFSSPFFRLQGQDRDVYLHCIVSLCDCRSSSCIPVCQESDDSSLSHLHCGSDKIRVGVSRAGSPLIGNLADHKCSRATEQDGVMLYEVDAQEGACGNTLMLNGTNVIYSNTLFIYPANNAISLPLRIPFSCVYPLDTQTRLNTAIRPFNEEDVELQDLDDQSLQSGALEVSPQWQVMEGVFVGSGVKLRASMFLFKESDYKEPYPAGVVVLPAGSPLYVEVSVDKKDPSLVVVLEECFASLSSDPDRLERYSFISNKCPTDRQQVFEFESGSSLQARFSALFIPEENDQDFYVHCSLSLCDRRRNACIPSCPRRVRRSVSEAPPIKPLTIGPITWEKSF
ncbi:uncharacterized protein LOC129181213 isoform X1 [Dunckerocampus dactyliophorus]|uniref:uncharacterized protein LOC129181213 isoform X1 n=1 Tax=Dunckerocampus dactyliophorus TaxID=161453 RepID=UPI0024058780|nr:uncharacterized protein LOC129181213 isoform X1 [Dunckerocampus dactyliophorus]